MRFTRITALSLFTAGLCLAAACGGNGTTSTSSSTTTGTTGQGGHGGGQGGTGGVGGQGGEGGCASTLLCGTPAVCCDEGSECLAGGCTPKCASGVRCDGACCAGGQVCLSAMCVTPTTPCQDSFDCLETEFCEPTLGKCLPQPAGGPACQFKPEVLPFEPILEWSWTGSAIKPTYDQVLSVPLVVDLDKDGTPDVVLVTHDTGDGACDTGYAYLRALDGKTGQEKWGAAVEAYGDAARVALCRTPAVADIDGDGKPDIVAPRFGGGLIALRGDGSILWTSTMADGATPYSSYLAALATVSIADMNHDGSPEIVVGGVIFDAKGRVKAGAGLESLGNNGFGGPNTIVADVDGDGMMEVVSGTQAYRLDGSVLWSNAMADGYTAVADFDGAQGSARVHDAATGALLAALDMPGVGAGGPPTIADFNGDGLNDFASAVGDSYTIFTFSKLPAPAISVLWSVPTLDVSSSRTGSSVFDFEGDGFPEVLYSDECYLRVYNGKTGAVLYQLANSSGTASQYPIAVDVDGDHNTELVVVADDKYQINGQTPGCPTYQAGEKLRHGVFVYGDKHDKWVRTRKVWNQHSYHISNVNADGSLPSPEVKSWTPAGHNSYRVSAQGSDVYNAPDLTVDLAVLNAGCPDSVTLRATVGNQGSLGVAAGVEVTFSYGDALMLLGKTMTTKALLPGQSEEVELDVPLAGKTAPYAFHVDVDGTAQGPSLINECNEANNHGAVDGVTCPKLN
jgi:hypothetical protein